MKGERTTAVFDMDGATYSRDRAPFGMRESAR